MVAVGVRGISGDHPRVVRLDVEQHREGGALEVLCHDHRALDGHVGWVVVDGLEVGVQHFDTARLVLCALETRIGRVRLARWRRYRFTGLPSE